MLVEIYAAELRRAELVHSLVCGSVQASAATPFFGVPRE